MDSSPDDRTAVEACLAELKCYSLAEFPVDYAEIQTNLGSVYGTLAGTCGKEKNCLLAIGAYREALRVFLPGTFPVEHAMVQNNLGNVYSTLAEVKDPAGALKFHVLISKLRQVGEGEDLDRKSVV